MAGLRRIYVDTSVFGGLFEPEFQHDSERFLALVNAQEFELVISDLVEREARGAPEHVRAVLEAALPYCTAVKLAAAAEQLALAYLAGGVLSSSSLQDAQHVALAVVSACDAIASWNFKHIVNDRRIPLFNAVNTEWGYNPIGIYLPRQVLKDEH